MAKQSTRRIPGTGGEGAPEAAGRGSEHAERSMDVEKISDDPEIQAHYEMMRRNGESHRFAEMIALGQVPFTKSFERMFFEGHSSGSEFAGLEEVGNAYRKVAEKAGQSTTGRKYCSALARFPGDPLAWIGDESDARRAVEAGNFETEGALKMKRPITDRDPGPSGPRVAKDIVDRVLAEEVESTPEIAAEGDKGLAEARERVEKRLTGKVVKS